MHGRLHLLVHALMCIMLGDLQVYLPMCFIYGLRDKLRPTPLTAALRQELYTQDYSTISWDSTRNQCASEDLFYPHPKVIRARRPCCSVHDS